MRLVLLFTLLTLGLNAQNEIEVIQNGNQLCFVNKVSPSVDWYQFNVQNKDNFSQYIWFWGNSPDTCVTVPYCNTRCSRTAFNGTMPILSNVVETSQLDIQVSIKHTYNKIGINITGTWDKAIVTLWDINGKQIPFVEGLSVQWDYPELKILTTSKNTYNQPRFLRVIYESGNCKGVLTRLIYF